MNSESIDLPDSLLDRINFSATDQKALGRLGNEIVKVYEKNEGPAYLKIGAGVAGQDLSDEAERLNWLSNRLPVPKVLFNEKVDNRTIILISELPGQPMHERFETTSRSQVIEQFAEALKTVHSIDITDCPFVDVVKNDLIESERRLSSPGLDEVGFKDDTGFSPSELFRELSERATTITEGCFTHGDFCFPNVLMAGDQIGGIVDWGIAGVSNVNRDFMSAELTIKRNCGEEWLAPFYEAYGDADYDPDLVKYFWLLDRYFSHYSEPE